MNYEVVSLEEKSIGGNKRKDVQILMRNLVKKLGWNIYHG